MAALPAALTALRDGVAAAPLTLDVPGADAARRSARSVVDQVDDYLLPRLLDLDAPLLTVVGGSTGAGKSTLVNSLVGGAPVTAAGVLRPTTRSPVLVCAPADRPAFAGDRVLPGLARTTVTPGPAERDSAPAEGLRLVVRDELPAGLALLDAPDVDSVVTANRELAGQLLAAADLWVFVTTAARYADAVPWDLLRQAQERGTALAVVLDRVPPEAVAEVSGDLSSMLQRAGLPGARLFVVEERALSGGLLPESQVEPLRSWLHALAADAGARAAVVRQTLAGALDSLDGRLEAIVTAVRAQDAAAGELQTAADDAYARARAQIDDGVSGGALLRGEVLARWQEFVGTGEWMRGLQSGIGRLRDRLAGALSGRPVQGQALGEALESSVEQLMRGAADAAAEGTVVAWRSLPGGRALLAGDAGALERAAPEFGERAAGEVHRWQGFVLELVREQGADKRTTARLLSFGVNGAGLVVMIAVFAQTGGLTGTEVAVAGGTSAVGQRLLEAVFGDEAVRRLAAGARDDLRERVDRLLAQEQHRFDARLAAAAPAPDSAQGLRVAAQALAAARR